MEYQPESNVLSESLPGIDIAVAVEQRQFLERMAVIAEQSGQFKVERHFDAINNGALDIVNFRYLGRSPHDGVGGQLIGRDDRPGRILVEMRAEHWDPELPTRAVYRAAADDLMLPLLRAYNCTFGARYRFRVQKPGLKGFVPSPLTITLFDRFAILANTHSLHPLDWDRFYTFVRESRQEIPGHELRAMLVARGFSRDKAEHLAEIYAHLWNFKRRKWL